MRSDKAMRNAFRRLQLSTADDPKAAVGILVAALPNDIRCGWDELEFDNQARIAFAYQNPGFAHLLTAGMTLPTFREELEWILGQFDEGLPDGSVLDVGAGAGVTAAVVALAAKRSVIACEPAAGAAAAIDHVAEVVGVEVRAIEASAAELPEDEWRRAAVVVSQSVLCYIEFGADCNCEEAARSAFISGLASVGEALVVEHTSNVNINDDGHATWLHFAKSMSDAGMYPIWESASIVSGYTALIPDVPAHERPMYARPKLCLRFSKSGDQHDIESRLVALLDKNPSGTAWTD